MGVTLGSRAIDACALTAVAASGVPGDGGDIRVGVDVVLISGVSDSIASFGARYLQRIYTAQELGDCGDGAGEVAASRLAARFAVKEAVTKVLAPADAPGWWCDIETVRASSGACELRLRGAAAELADRRGLSGWGVSVTHEGEYAAAVVVARSGDARQVQAVSQEAEA